MTGQECGRQDRQLPSSSFISTPAVLSTAAIVGRSAHLSSLGFLLPSTVLRLVLLLRWPIWWLGVFLLLLRFRWLAVKRNNREGGATAGVVRSPLGLEGTSRASWRRWLASVVSCWGRGVTGREGNGWRGEEREK
ncbi:hypothetical protein NC651_034253 [Populus alba x Populus x berolinensis]|nr:hypothetical protein NC651_034253 [Populus alba x Populus x berolinensis]